MRILSSDTTEPITEHFIREMTEAEGLEMSDAINRMTVAATSLARLIPLASLPSELMSGSIMIDENGAVVGTSGPPASVKRDYFEMDIVDGRKLLLKFDQGSFTVAIVLGKLPTQLPTIVENGQENV